MDLPESIFPEMERAAREGARRSYCPYSRFPVGAAVLTAAGTIFTGCNVENASLSLSICAERSAIFHAVGGGEREIRVVVIYTPTPEPVMPCGACLQVLAELGPEATIVSVCDGSDCIETAVHLLLPKAFRLGESMPQFC